MMMTPKKIINKIELFKPHKGQKELIKAIQLPQNKFITAVIGRQWGKTTFGENMALKWTIDTKNTTVLWVSPTFAQCKKVFDEIINNISHIPNLIKSKTSSASNMQIIFYNDSKILFKSAASEDSIRGYSVDYLIVDEVAFIKKEIIELILLPTLTVKGKKCLYISTPRGKNHLYDYYLRGGKEDGWVSFRFPSHSSPLVNDDILKQFKINLPPKVYEQEILAKFVDAGNVFNNLNDILTLEPQIKPIQGETYYFGIDIGLVTDATVISVINNKGNLVNYYRYTEKPTPFILNKINELNKIWKPKKIAIEQNNQGLPIIQSLTLKNIVPFITSNKTKTEIIDNLIHLFNTNDIQCVKDNKLENELEGFEFKLTKSGLITYSAKNGYMDDIVMSLAIGRWCYNKYKKTTKLSYHII